MSDPSADPTTAGQLSEPPRAPQVQPAVPHHPEPSEVTADHPAGLAHADHTGEASAAHQSGTLSEHDSNTFTASLADHSAEPPAGQRVERAVEQQAGQATGASAQQSLNPLAAAQQTGAVAHSTETQAGHPAESATAQTAAQSTSQPDQPAHHVGDFSATQHSEPSTTAIEDPPAAAPAPSQFGASKPQSAFTAAPAPSLFSTAASQSTSDAAPSGISELREEVASPPSSALAQFDLHGESVGPSAPSAQLAEPQSQRDPSAPAGFTHSEADVAFPPAQAQSTHFSDSQYRGESSSTAAQFAPASHPQQQYGEPAPGPAAHFANPEIHGQSVMTLEPDTATPTDSDADSAFEGNSTASTSLASSILNYEYTNGRRYHGYRSGAYVLPNDDEEQDRLDLLHHIFLLMLGGKLYDAPIPNPPQKVLDIGTGTGIWAIDYADENPSCEVLGTDLSPIQPTWVPPNVRFYIDDAESDWIYGTDEKFDFIHVRGLSGSIKDWETLCRRAYENVQPGGWVELQEPEAWVLSDDDTVQRAPSLQQWQSLCNEAAAMFGKEIRVGPSLKEMMLNAGFVDVHEKIVKVPLGPWPKDPKMKEIGRYQREHMAMGVEVYTLGFIGKVLGWSEDECKVLTAKVINEVRDRSLHMYIRFYFVYGRKADSAMAY